MKLLICSDIHGDLDSMKRVISAYENEDADKLVILGDLLYHGPRNDLPPTSAPKAVIEILNAHREDIISVRGNCDTEVDQMVLSFPILSDYSVIYTDGLTLFLTHGHKLNPDNPPPLGHGEILLTGHTHVQKCVEFGDGNFYINPGSVALPKENNPRTYMIYENRCFTLKTFEGEIIFTKVF